MVLVGCRPPLRWSLAVRVYVVLGIAAGHRVAAGNRRRRDVTENSARVEPNLDLGSGLRRRVRFDSDGGKGPDSESRDLLSLFGLKLTDKSGASVSTAEALAKVDAVMIYFSAHWCPPCRQFTPELAKTYEHMKAAGKKMELVFVSADNDEEEFREYLGQMPWLALPYAKRKLKERLSKQFNVRGIPMLVVVDADGNLITTDGRSKISADPVGARFPWRPPEHDSESDEDSEHEESTRLRKTTEAEHKSWGGKILQFLTWGVVTARFGVGMYGRYATSMYMKEQSGAGLGVLHDAVSTLQEVKAGKAIIMEDLLMQLNKFCGRQGRCTDDYWEDLPKVAAALKLGPGTWNRKPLKSEKAREIDEILASMAGHPSARKPIEREALRAISKELFNVTPESLKKSLATWRAIEREEDGVIVLTKETFDSVIEEHGAVLVAFTAPWCSHCKKLEPEYVKAAAALKAEDPPLHLARVDGTDDPELVEKYGVLGFPTLKLIRHGGNVSEYNGERKSTNIIEFMRKKVGSPAKTLSSVAEFEQFKAQADVVVVGFFDDKDSAAARTFVAVAAAEDAVAFAFSTDTTIGELGEAANTAVVLKTFDEGRSVLSMTENTSEAELREFVSGYSIPLVDKFSLDKAKAVLQGSAKILALAFVDTAADTQVDEVRTALGEVAVETRGKVRHLYVPSSEVQILDYFDVGTDALPKLMLVDTSDGGMKKYLFASDELTAENIRAFEASFFDNALLPYLKSEEPDGNDLSEPVKRLVGKTFVQHVLDNDKDVLVQFYAPWCPHCKALEPKWEELAKKFESVESIVIAKIDMTANEINVDGLNIRGFPSIFYFPGNAKSSSPVEFDSSRSVDGFTKFLQQHATSPWHIEAEGDGVRGGPGYRDEES